MHRYIITYMHIAYVYIARLEFRQENLILRFNYVKRLKHYAYLKQLIIFKIFKTNYVHTIHFTHVGKGSSAGKKSKYKSKNQSNQIFLKDPQIHEIQM